MQVNKSIAALALTASSAFALIAPPKATKTVCLSVHEDAGGVMYAGNCDEARNNEQLGLELLANGCAADQIALRATKHRGQEGFDINIHSCLPPNVVQL